MRATIYARYSSENQRDASIEDQIEVCRRFVERQGWTLVRGYEDRSISGASRFRPGYQELSGDLDRGLFDVVVVEALDRLGRKLADVADLHDRLGFAGIKLYAVATGEITGMHIGMLGTMAQLFLADLRETTWRGQLGRALQGKQPGGKAFGYDVVEIVLYPRGNLARAREGLRRRVQCGNWPIGAGLGEQAHRAQAGPHRYRTQDRRDHARDRDGQGNGRDQLCERCYAAQAPHPPEPAGALSTQGRAPAGSAERGGNPGRGQRDHPLAHRPHRADAGRRDARGQALRRSRAD